MANIYSTIESCFMGAISTTRRTYPYNSSGTVESSNAFHGFIEIPIGKPTVEIPVFLFKLMKINECPANITKVVYPLNLGKVTLHYKSVEPIVRDSLRQIDTKCLNKIEMQNGNLVYYSTYGAIFDRNLNPIFMLTWECNKEGTGYWASNPIIRLSPTEFIANDDPVVRLLNRKVLVSGLNYTGVVFDSHGNRKAVKAKVIIEDIPFNVFYPKTPSINTDKDGLMALALQYNKEVKA